MDTESVPSTEVEVSLSYVRGQVNALCQDRSLYDLIILTIKGTGVADVPSRDLGHTCVVTARSQVAQEIAKLLAIIIEVKMSDIDTKKLIELQQKDLTQQKYHTQDITFTEGDEENPILRKKECCTGSSVNEHLLNENLSAK